MPTNNRLIIDSAVLEAAKHDPEISRLLITLSLELEDDEQAKVYFLISVPNLKLPQHQTVRVNVGGNAWVLKDFLAWRAGETKVEL